MNDFVTSFEAACAAKGIAPELPDVTNLPEWMRKRILAEYRLDVILQVNNDGWVANIADTDQWKYFPCFEIEPDENSASGFGLSCFGHCSISSDAYLYPQACKSAELAEFMGNTFTHLYMDLLA